MRVVVIGDNVIIPGNIVLPRGFRPTQTFEDCEGNIHPSNTPLPSDTSICAGTRINDPNDDDDGQDDDDDDDFSIPIIPVPIPLPCVGCVPPLPPPIADIPEWGGEPDGTSGVNEKIIDDWPIEFTLQQNSEDMMMAALYLAGASDPEGNYPPRDVDGPPLTWVTSIPPGTTVIPTVRPTQPTINTSWDPPDPTINTSRDRTTPTIIATV